VSATTGSPPPTPDDATVRAATVDDVPDLAALIAEFARRGDVLPRAADAIRVTLGDWIVAEADGIIVGCAAIHRYGAGLGEVRTTIVLDAWQGRGLGRRLVDAIAALAVQRGIPTLFTLTRRAPFFERLGFEPVDKATFPEKVWKDCRTCPLIDNCDEVALQLDVAAASRSLIDAFPLDSAVPRDAAPIGASPAGARDPRQRRSTVTARPTIKRAVLAYSGGLDTSVIVPWLRENYGCEVVCFCADLGQGDELEGLRDKALASGAVDCVVQDLREEFARDFLFPMLQAGAVYERQYLLGTAIARPLIAKQQVAVAEAVGADALAHGCTGKGNDQVRFELTYQALNPALRVVAPWREWHIRSREDALAFADAHNVPIASREKSVYSRDRNLWHISHEGGRLEDPRLEPEAGMFLWTVDPRAAPDQPEEVQIGFEAGVPVAVDDERLAPAELIARLNAVAARHGVGRVDLVENRLVGMKSRGVYETPGGTLLYAAHREVESLCLDRETAHHKELITARYAELVYFGQWFHPLRESLQAFISMTQQPVTGWARLRLFKGGVTVVGRYSANSLYREDFATFGRDDVYDQGDAAGFIHLFGLPMKVRAMMEVSDGGRTRYASPDFSRFKRD